MAIAIAVSVFALISAAAAVLRPSILAFLAAAALNAMAGWLLCMVETSRDLF